MHIIRLLRRYSSLLEGPQFTELILYLCQLSLLSTADMQKIQVVDSVKQVDYLLDVLETSSRRFDSDDFLIKLIGALRKANYILLANRIVSELQSLQDGQDVVDSNPRSSTGSSGISYPPNMPSRAPSNVDSSFSGSLGIYSGESMSTSYPSRLAAVVDKYRQEYVTKSLDIGVLQISEHDALVERAIADLPVMVMRTARYARLLKNVHTNVADYYARASLAFHCLELYGLSLLRYPWKSELQKISTVSGVYRLRIASHVTDASVVLVDMGFAKQTDSLFVLTGVIDRERTIEAAFQCFLMVVHCRRMCLINSRDSVSGSMDSGIGKSNRPSIASQASASIRSRDSGFGGELTYHNVPERRDNSSREYQNVSSYSKSGMHRASVDSTSSSSYYSNVSRDSVIRDSSFRSSQNATTSSTRAPSSLSNRMSALSLATSEQQSQTSSSRSTVLVDQSTVDTITKFMEGIPDEGLSTLLCMPQASSSRQQGQVQGQTSNRTTPYSMPNPVASSIVPPAQRNASTPAAVDRDFKETSI